MNGPSVVQPFYTYILTNVEPNSLFRVVHTFPLTPWIGKEETATDWALSVSGL